MINLFLALGIVGVVLNLAVVGLLLRGYIRTYPVLFALNLLQPAITIVELILFRNTSATTSRYQKVYWTAEVIWDLLLFALVAHLIQKLYKGRPEGVLARNMLLIVGIAVIILPFLLYYNLGLFTVPWFSGASQLFNFGAAVLNLVLWGALITSPQRATHLMLVCTGLGINVAGAALAWGVRRLAAGHSMVVSVQTGADLFAALTYLMGLLIWCWAFRNPAGVTEKQA
jgi:hypothetical protein